MRAGWRPSWSDGGFLAAIVATFVLSLLGFGGAKLIEDSARTERNPLVLSQHQWIPQGDSMTRVRVGLPYARALAIASRLGVGDQAGMLWRTSEIVDFDGQRMAADMLNFSPEAFASVFAPHHARCEEGMLWFDKAQAPVFGQRLSVDIEGVANRLAFLDLGVVRSLVSASGPMLAVRCSQATQGSIQAMLISSTQINKAALATLAQDESFFRAELFGHELAYSRLDSEIGNSLRAEFGWAASAAKLSLLLSALLFAARGVLRGLGSRSEFIQRRMHGASLGSLALRTTAQTTAWAGIALALALAGYWALRRSSDVFAQTPWPSSSDIIMVLLIAVISGVFAQWLVAQRGVDTRLLEGVSGARRTVGLKPFLLLWSFGLTLALVFTVISVGALRNALALTKVDVGYEPRGLIALPVRVAGDVETDALAQTQTQMLSWASANFASRASLICPGIWEFSGHQAVLGNDSTIGVLIGAGPSVLSVLGVKQFEGHDFTSADAQQQSDAAIVQGSSDYIRMLSAMRMRAAAVTSDLMVGMSTPHVRPLTILPIAKQSCRDFSLILRDSRLTATAVRELENELRKQFPSAAIGHAVEIDHAIQIARRPANRVAILLATSAVISVALQLVFTAALLLAYFESNQRELAIRMALGLTASGAAHEFSMRALRWTIPALVLAFVALYGLQAVLSSWMLGFRAVSTAETCALLFFFSASALLGSWCFARQRSRAVPLQRALAGNC